MKSTANKTITDRLSARLVILFAKVKARKKQMEEKEKKLNTFFKSALKRENFGCNPDISFETSENEEGYEVKTYTYGPADSPFQLEYKIYGKFDISWKTECEQMYIKHYGLKRVLHPIDPDNNPPMIAWEAELLKRMEEIGKVEADKLEVKPNPNYREFR